MELKSIDGGQGFDFGKTSAAYAAFRDIYPKELYGRLSALGVAADGSSWLDLGTGTGVLPKNLYNPNARIVGADISAAQIAFAEKEAENDHLHIRYLTASAENTGLPSHNFDAITAAQCFFYFDREKMKREIARLLKPGGIFIKVFMDWSESDPVAGPSVALVRQMNPAWRSGDAALRDMADDLFPGRVSESFFADLPFTRESWHGRMCACRGTLASMDPATFNQWETAHLRLLRQFPESFAVRHQIMLSCFRFR